MGSLQYFTYSTILQSQVLHNLYSNMNKTGLFFKSPHISTYFCPKTSPKDIPMLLLTLISKVSWRSGVSLIVGLWCALLPGCWCRSGLCFLQICPVQKALPIKFMQIDTTTNQTLASSFDLFRR